MVIITGDHTRIAAHMQAIKYLTLDIHPLSFGLVCSQHGINLAKKQDPRLLVRQKHHQRVFPFSFLGLLSFVVLEREIIQLGVSAIAKS